MQQGVRPLSPGDSIKVTDFETGQKRSITVPTLTAKVDADSEVDNAWLNALARPNQADLDAFLEIFADMKRVVIDLPVPDILLGCGKRLSAPRCIFRRTARQ